MRSKLIFMVQRYIQISYEPNIGLAECLINSYQSITPNTTNLQPGDLVFYASGGVVDHVALYIGNGKVVQASTPKEGIVISKFNYRTPHSAKRVL